MKTWIGMGCLLLMLSSGAAADMRQGTLGEQSRATIQISVSVAPRFNFRSGDTDMARAQALRSNVPTSRFSVERIDHRSASSETKLGRAGDKPQSSDGPSLLLVIPD